MWIKQVYGPETETGTGEPAAADSQNQNLTQEEVKNILDFDPFEPPAGGKEPAAQEEKPDAAGRPSVAKSKAETDDVPVKEQTLEEPQKTTPDPVETKLASIADLLERQAQQREQQPAAKAAETAPAPKFNFDVPAQITAALASEDPNERQLGVNNLVNGLSNAIYNEIKKEFTELNSQMATQLTGKTSQLIQVERAQQKMREEFYGEYPQIPQTPRMQQMVAVIANQLAQQKGSAYNWDANFRKELVTQLYAELGIQVPVVAKANGSNGVKKVAPKQPFATGASGSKGGDIAAKSPEIQDIWDTLDIK